MMHLLRTMTARVIALFRKRSLDSDLDQELRSHVEMATDLNLRRGMSAEQARREALLSFGGVETTKQVYREQRGLPIIETTLQDLRYALRMLRRKPGFAIVAVLSIALGIGANTAIFSLIYALLLRSLPVPNPGELVQVGIVIAGKPSDSFSYPVIKALAARKDVFANLGGYSGATFTVGPPSAPVRTLGACVSGGFFPALELQPVAGRLLTDDDTPGAPLVAVISDGYWERNFHRDPRAIGARLLIEGHPAVIVGVTPAGFTGANVGEIADLTMTFQAFSQLSPRNSGLLEAGNQFNRILSRLAAGHSIEQARAQLRVIWPAMASVSFNPNAPAKRREAMLASKLELMPGGTGWTPLRNQYSKPLYILLFISGLVLLVACANVANLLLARSTARCREIGIRFAMGAGRARIIRQLLIESLLLAFIGSALGLILAGVGSRVLLVSVSPGSQAIPLDVGLNGPVLGFTIAVTVLVALLFGLAPALRVTSTGPGPALKNGERTVALSRGRLGPALVSIQVALSLLLLIGGGLFIRTLRNLESIDPGFRHEGVLMLDIDGRRVIPPGPQADPRLRTLYRDGIQAIAAINGVEAVSVSNFTPVSGGVWSQSVLVNGRKLSDEEPVFFAVSPKYFSAMSIRMIAGRDFNERDDLGAPPVVIVNEEFVRRLIPQGEPLGQQVSASDSTFWQNMEIVGVTANSVPYNLREPARPCVFVPFFQLAPGRMAFGTFEIKTAGSFRAVASAVEQTMRPRVSGLPLKVRSFTEQVEGSLRRQILMARLGGFFSILALILAAVGLYGLLAYTVTQRSSEIGIRMALGAQRTTVLKMVLLGAARLVVAGVLIGLPVAWWASQLVASMLYGLTPTDPLTIGGAVFLLVATGPAAGFLPARRASRVDPMVALKYE